jgi:hypothetical protein
MRMCVVVVASLLVASSAAAQVQVLGNPFDLSGNATSGPTIGNVTGDPAYVALVFTAHQGQTVSAVGFNLVGASNPPHGFIANIYPVLANGSVDTTGGQFFSASFNSATGWFQLANGLPTPTALTAGQAYAVVLNRNGVSAQTITPEVGPTSSNIDPITGEFEATARTVLTSADATTWTDTGQEPIFYVLYSTTDPAVPSGCSGAANPALNYADGVTYTSVVDFAVASAGYAGEFFRPSSLAAPLQPLGTAGSVVL